MPRRYRPPTRRRKKRRGPPNIPLAPLPPPAVEETRQARAGELAQTPAAAASTAASSTARHVSRDYSYVLVELRRIALVIAIIVVGLLGATAALRWF